MILRLPRAHRFQSQDGCAVRTHESGNIRTDDVFIQQKFHAAQHGIVIESTALDHDMVAQFGNIFKLHNFKEGILNNADSDARRNIRQRRPFFLGLFNPGVHEHRTTGAQIYRRFRILRLAGKFRRGHVQAFRKVLDKGTAAGTTSFVQRNLTDIAVLDLEAFHILPADIQHAGYFRTKLLRRPEMGKGFHFAGVRMERRLDDAFAVTGGEHPGYITALRQMLIKFF